MKTLNQMTNDGRRIMVKRQAASIVNRRSQIANRGAFTLIELLVVIAIMAILASLTLAVVSGIKKTQWRNTATAELKQIETALERYKAKYGVYPPSNANPANTYLANVPPATNSMYPQLYYELSGVTNNGTYYTTLDGSAKIAVTDVQKAFGVGGFINCSKTGSDEASPAQNFLPGLRQGQFASVANDNGVAVTNIVTSVRGPDVKYMPLGEQDVNPFRYVYPGVNNPNSYDLWVELNIGGGKTNLICNWSSGIIVNSSYP